jgi:hypothetical protein
MHNTPWHDWLSTLLLLTAAGLAVALFRRRQAEPAASQPEFWLLAAGGLFFLAQDELFDYHSQLDYALHRQMGWKETAWSDRLDDAIIGLYLLGGALITWCYRREALSVLSATWGIPGTGFVAACLAILFDAASNNDHPESLPFLERYQSAFSVAEQVFELLALVCLVLGLALARRPAAPPITRSAD